MIILVALSPHPLKKLNLHGMEKLLIPAMKNFYARHHDFNIYAMTADSGFDDVLNYK